MVTAQFSPESELSSSLAQCDASIEKPVRLAIEFGRSWLPRLDARISELLDEEIDELHLMREPLRHLHDAGGKRVRPLLTLIACQLTGGDPAEALGVASAIELFHTASLILDDLPCMDDAPCRRGVTSVHVAHGEPLAILTAIALFNLAHRLFATDGAGDSGRRTKAHEHVARSLGCSGMVGAQQLDLLLRDGAVASSADLITRRLEKTSKLISAALVAGASIGVASEDEWSWLADFGIEMGRLFQLADDQIDHETDAQFDASTLPRQARRLAAETRMRFPRESVARDVFEGFTHLTVHRRF
jgi:geranylgeranyl diphosphate synthase type II